VLSAKLQEFQTWSLKTSGMKALAGYWALENPVADRLKPRFRVHLEFLTYGNTCGDTSALW
ncbi:MAG: hypothetical protein WAV70_15375, partial [Anaerolineae bacterium]